MFGITNRASAQVLTTVSKPDTVNKKTDALRVDTVAMLNDSLKKDTVVGDTSKRAQIEKRLGIKLSKDALPAAIKATATDSAVLDMKNNVFYLYGNSQVNYEDKQLNAGEIIYSQATSMVTAAPSPDSAESATNRPTFAQGKEKFTYDTLQYNFKTSKAIGRNPRMQYGEGYMNSQQIKRNPDQSIFGYKNTYTTCALDTPHFAIVANKVKVIPGKIIAAGSANIYIEGIPTPIFLPFALFPINEKQKSGFLLPSYSIEQARGLGLTNGGYYFYLNDHQDLLTQANIYTKGSWNFTGTTNYNDIYHYRGLFKFSYAYEKTGQPYETGASITKDFRLVWQHQSDAKSRPGESFNASVDAGTSSYYSNNSYNINQVLQNQYQSNITFSKNWVGKPFTFVIAARYSQNTQSKLTSLSLPEVNFNVSSFTPFHRKTAIGIHWYDKVTVGYTFNMVNHTSYYDSTFNFTAITSTNLQLGAVHKIPISASYTILRYFNLSFSANYNEYWLTDRIKEAYNDAEKKLDTTETHGFYAARDFSTAVSLSTRIYGMKVFKKGSSIGAIRHVITPAVSLSYNPDFGAAPFNYWYKTRLDSTQNYSYLTPFQRSVIGYPNNGKQGSVNFSVGNTLQLKVRSGKDTVTGYRKVSLLDGFDVRASYNAAADSFKWSHIALGVRTNILDKISISGGADYDPYVENRLTGRDINQLSWNTGSGLARFNSAFMSVGSNIHSKPRKGSGDVTNSEEYNRVLRNRGYDDYVDLNIPWSLNFSYSLNVTNPYSFYSQHDSVTLSHFVTISGDFNLTERWKVNFSTGYNFNQKQIQLTQIDVYRDLHCWEMHFSAIPFGPRKSFTFTLNVKAKVLQDLKLMKRRDYRDATY